jgi:hypothetical protein
VAGSDVDGAGISDDMRDGRRGRGDGLGLLSEGEGRRCGQEKEERAQKSQGSGIDPGTNGRFCLRGKLSSGGGIRVDSELNIANMNCRRYKSVSFGLISSHSAEIIAIL